MGSTLVAFLIAARLFAQTADHGKTVLDGVYSEGQAMRGQAAYTERCSACHLEDLTAYRGVLHGIAFVEHFQGDTLDSLFGVTQRSMPRGAPGSLDDRTYLDIVAYILQVNSYPSGRDDLKIDLLKTIQIVGKAGPEPVPNFALVAVIGCLAKGPDDAWTLARATEPERTRNPDASNGAELKTYEPKALATRTFGLLDVTYFRPDSLKDHKILAKGFLLRRPEGDQINTTSLQLLSATCTN